MKDYVVDEAELRLIAKVCRCSNFEPTPEQVAAFQRLTDIERATFARMSKPSVCRIVMYRPPTGPDVRPAIITKVWSETCVNLHVFGGLLIGANGEPEEGGCYPTSVNMSETEPRSWFWPPRE